MDDWDQRMLVTTLPVEREARRIILLQVAEKDQVSNIGRGFSDLASKQAFSADSKTTFTLDNDGYYCYL